MENIDEILKRDKITFEMISLYINTNSEDVYCKILSNLRSFDEKSKKKVCKYIVTSSVNENIIDFACREIICNIEYEFTYYKEISEISSLKKCHETWVNEIKRKLLEDIPNTLQFVFNDFSIDNPQSIDFDIQMIQELLNNYNEKYIEAVEISKERALIICRRLNDVITIDTLNIIKIFYYFDKKFSFSNVELNIFLDKYFFNYPYVCKKFVDNIPNDKESLLIKCLKEKILKFDEEQKIKHNMDIFKSNRERVILYRKQQALQNKKINKLSHEKSIFLSSLIGKSNTILYGNRYGVTITNKDEKYISDGKLQEFKFEYSYPLEYILDPVKYIEDTECLKRLGKKEKI